VSSRSRKLGVTVIAVLMLAAYGKGAHVGASIEAKAGHAPHATTVVYTSQTANEALGNSLAASGYGWTGSQEVCLDELWERESGWQDDIANPQSGAFGIAQALGHGAGAAATVDSVVRYPGGSSGSDVTVDEYPSAAANSGNARAQINWGLAYIRDAYGTPCGAWAHEESHSWY
jgi:resuscitation-promoting factor RpfB